MNNHYKGKWIGPKRIKELVLSDKKTILGQEVYLVKYRDGSTEELPKQVIKDTATDKTQDLSELRELRVKPVVSKIMGILFEADLKIDGEVGYTLDKTLASVSEVTNQAIEKLWGKEKYKRTMMDSRAILEEKE